MDEYVDQPRLVRDGEELPLSNLASYLRDNLPGADEPLEVRQFPSGFSNLTYLVKRGQQELVLRRPPFGNQVKSAHDMGREFRVLSKLCEIYPPAPRPYLYCEDDTIIGAPFYVMQRRHGVVLRDSAPPPRLASDPALVGRLCESFVANLSQLHRLDYQAAGLGDLGKPDGYVRRQVEGWTERYKNAQTDGHKEIDETSQWLAASVPGESGAALIHNDYKYNNLMLDPNDLTRIVAVFDWEMATVGDPLMDLGTSLAYWVEASDPPALLESAFGPTMAPGSMSRRQLVSRYEEETGREVPDILFFYCYGLFKLAVIIQQIYARFVRGHTRDQRFAKLNRLVETLGSCAARAIERETI